MRLNIVLIDSENVKPEAIEKLRQEHFRVMVFVGTNQKRFDFPIVKAIQSLGSNGSYVEISGNGPNALDFHIAYYVGTLSASNPGAYFHIISNDKGFDPLIEHLTKEQKISCYRFPSVSDIPLVKAADKRLLKERVADFYEKRIASAKNRPANITSLQSVILSHFHKLLSPEEVTKVVEALKRAGYVVVNEKKIEYPERS